MTPRARRRLVTGGLGLALAAIVACQVSTEGAPCRDDGSCPSGQRCGGDRRCSVKAASCTACADGETICVAGGLATCAVAPDGICRAFGAPVAPGPRQVCDASTPGAAQILCPAAGGTFYVDPVGGSDASATPAPTGASAPAICRFRALRPAIDAANARVQAAAGASATIVVSATVGTAPFTLSEGAFDLQPAVTLTSDAPASPVGPPASLPYVLELAGTLTVHEGATLSGLELRPAAGFPAGGDGIVTSCAPGATAPAVVQDARVVGTDAGALFASGVHQTGACPLTVARTSVAGGGKGIFVEGSSTAVVRIDASEVRGAKDVGVHFSQVPSTVQVHVTNTLVHGNCATIDAVVNGGIRRAGGVLFTTVLPTLEFRGNRVSDNQGDQLLVAATATTPAFSLTGDSTATGGRCPVQQDANHFTCRDTSADGTASPHVVVFSSGATVPALGNFWPNVPPVPNVDFGPVSSPPTVSPVSPRVPLDSGLQMCGQDTVCAGTPATCP